MPRTQMPGHRGSVKRNILELLDVVDSETTLDDCETARGLARNLNAYFTAGGPVPAPFNEFGQPFLSWIYDTQKRRCGSR